MKWYKQSIEEVLTKVDSQTTGLSKEEREARLKNNGPNQMEEKEQVKLWRKIAKAFDDLLMIVLIAAALLKFATGELAERWNYFLKL